jgi:hypothetical protein
MDKVEDTDIQSITEQIIIKITVTKINVKTCDIFNYVDNNIDDWNIDIGDHFLDDICDIVVTKLKKREVLTTASVKNSNFIEFKMDEETQEKIMLDKIERSYNKITRQTIKMKSVYENEESDEESDKEQDSSQPLNSWDKRLERIENIYKKYEETTKTNK